jgi:predicted  nucleic acid-binding Zn-ribbon protein
MGESSTDSPTNPEEFRSRPNQIISVPLQNGRVELEYETLESEMDTVKERIVNIISEKQHLIKENLTLKSELGYLHVDSHNEDHAVSLPINIDHLSKPSTTIDTCTQTTLRGFEDREQSIETRESDIIQQLRGRIVELESEAMRNNAAFEKERKDLKDQCAELESSLDLLRVEYEKCEDYWHDKLQEARDSYEQDRNASDDKLHDVIQKIKEYEEAFMPMMNYDKQLPPIEERASLERQVTDLEEECEGLKKELYSIKVEQDSAITDYQKQFEV